MSVPYHKKIFSNEKVTLNVNFSGISKGDRVSHEDLSMSFYAYESSTGNPIFAESLKFDEIATLYNHLSQVSIIKNNCKGESGKFLEATSDIQDILERFERADPELLKMILGKLSADEKVRAVFENLTALELDNLTAAHKQNNYKGELEKLNRLLLLEEEGNIVKEIKSISDLSPYVARQPEKIFQNWIEKNLWVFGVEYIRKYDARKISLFSEGDLLMLSMDGFLDLIELKRPKLKYEIFQYDTSHKSYYPTVDISKVIGQCLFYLQKMDEYKSALEQEYKIHLLSPRIKIIAGRTKEFNDKQVEALRMLNSNLNHIQIISYDHLLSCGNQVISAYS